MPEAISVAALRRRGATGSPSATTPTMNAPIAPMPVQTAGRPLSALSPHVTSRVRCPVVAEQLFGGRERFVERRLRTGFPDLVAARVGRQASSPIDRRDDDAHARFGVEPRRVDEHALAIPRSVVSLL